MGTTFFVRLVLEIAAASGTNRARNHRLVSSV